VSAYLDIVVAGAAAQSTEWPWGELEAWTSALGQEIEALVGRAMTRLLEPLAPTATRAVVESTFRWPAAGAGWIRGQRVRWTSKTDGTLEGLSYPEPRDPRDTIAAWSPVVLDPQSVAPSELPTAFMSALDAACRNTSPATATGRDLKIVSDLLGLPLIASWNADDWRAALSWASSIARDRRPVIDGFLRRLLRSFEIPQTVSLSASQPQRLTAASAWVTVDDVGRWVTVDGRAGTYVVVAVDETAGLWAELSRLGGGPWGLAGAYWTGTTTTTARLLAYALAEDPRQPARLTVQLWRSDLTVPPSYLQPPSAWLLYQDETSAFQVGDRLESANGATATIAVLVDNGTHGALGLHDYDPSGEAFGDGDLLVSTRPDGTLGGVAVANGAPGDQLLAFDGETGGGFALGDEVVGQLSNTIATVTGGRTNGSAGLLALAFVEAPRRFVDGETLERADGSDLDPRADADGYSRVRRGRQWLLYDGSTTTPTVGEVMTGGTSTATGIVTDVVDVGGTGAVQLRDVVGVFVDGETLTGGLGADGAVNGQGGDHLVTYDAETGGGFAVGDRIHGASSGVWGVVVGVYDAGTTGRLAVQSDGDGGAATAYYLDNEALSVGGSTRGLANGDSRLRERPAGEPVGGMVLRDVAIDGTSRHPIYLRGSGADPELAALLDRMMPGGTDVEVVWGAEA